MTLPVCLPPNSLLQDGITAFEALESGVLHPLRELLLWLEGTAAGAGPTRRPLLTASAKVAAELERDAVGALALVPTSASEAKNGRGTEAEAGMDKAAGSVAVLEVGFVNALVCFCGEVERMLRAVVCFAAVRCDVVELRACVFVVWWWWWVRLLMLLLLRRVLLLMVRLTIISRGNLLKPSRSLATKWKQPPAPTADETHMNILCLMMVDALSLSDSSTTSSGSRSSKSRVRTPDTPRPAPAPAAVAGAEAGSSVAHEASSVAAGAMRAAATAAAPVWRPSRCR